METVEQKLARAEANAQMWFDRLEECLAENRKMKAEKRADISQATLDRLVDVFIDFVREKTEAKPVAWRWYDDVNERWEFSVREENLPPHAQPLFGPPAAMQ